MGNKQLKPQRIHRQTHKHRPNQSLSAYLYLHHLHICFIIQDGFSPKTKNPKREVDGKSSKEKFTLLLHIYLERNEENNIQNIIKT